MSKSKRQYESRIITRQLQDGNTEISVSMRPEGCDHSRETEIRTGLSVPEHEVEKTCRQIAEQFKRAGDKISDVRMR